VRPRKCRKNVHTARLLSTHTFACAWDIGALLSTVTNSCSLAGFPSPEPTHQTQSPYLATSVTDISSPLKRLTLLFPLPPSQAARARKLWVVCLTHSRDNEDISHPSLVILTESEMQAEVGGAEASPNLQASVPRVGCWGPDAPQRWDEPYWVGGKDGGGDGCSLCGCVRAGSREQHFLTSATNL